MFAIGDILKSGVRNFPNKEAIVFEDVRLTYREFNDRVNRLANAIVSMGYWKQPELTQQVLKEGWLHTGDVGYLDLNGYLYVLGHKINQRLYNREGSASLKGAALATVHSDPAGGEFTFAAAARAM